MHLKATNPAGPERSERTITRRRSTGGPASDTLPPFFERTKRGREDDATSWRGWRFVHDLPPSSANVPAFLTCTIKPENEAVCWRYEQGAGYHRRATAEAVSRVTSENIKQQKDWRGAWACIARMRTAVPEGQRRHFSYDALVRKCVDQQQLDAAHDAFNLMIEDGVELTQDPCGYLILADLRADRIDDAQSVIQRMLAARRPPLESVVVSFVKACTKVKQAQQASDLLDAIKEAGFEPGPKARNALIGAWGAVGRPDKAQEVFDAIAHVGLPQTVRSFGALVKACAQAGQISGARAAFERMMAPPHSIPPNCTIGCILIDAYRLEGRIHDAEDVFQRMLDCQVEPDMPLILSMFMAYEDAGRLDQLGWVQERAALAGMFSLRTVMNLMDAYAQFDRIDDARAVFQQADPRRGSLLLNEMMIKLYAKAGRVKEAQEVFAIISHSPKAASYLIRAYAQAGMVQAAQDFYDSIGSPDIYCVSALILAYALTGRVDEAQARFDSMPRLGLRPNVFSFVVLMKAYVVGGRASEVPDIFRRMQQAGLEPDRSAWNLLMEACGNARDPDGAVAAYTAMVDAGIEPDATSIARMIAAYGSGGRLPEARAWFNKVGALGVRLNVEIFNAMITAEGKGGEWVDARRLFDQLDQSGMGRNIGTCNALMTVYANANMADEAKALHTLMLRHGPRPNVATLTALLTAYGNAGCVPEALEVFGAIRREQGTAGAMVYAALITAYANAAKHEPRWADAAELIADGMPPGLRNVTIDNALITAYGNARRPDEASRVFVSMNEGGVPAARRPTRGTYNALVAAHATTGNVAGVLQVMRSMPPDFRPDITTYSLLIRALDPSKRTDECQRLLQSAIDARVLKPRLGLLPLVPGKPAANIFDFRESALAVDLPNPATPWNADAQAALIGALLIHHGWSITGTTQFIVGHEAAGGRIRQTVEEYMTRNRMPVVEIAPGVLGHR
ncbi:hypothetical protein GCM10023165_41590 [Variovorax defluvii]|uniref:PROP1-like PPR domain-containing protein n=1 Tax=Variovorax defluvii TaxID=913761 RepID=A0ABP8I714_9BURK